jgi:hypothetical protein
MQTSDSGTVAVPAAQLQTARETLDNWVREVIA